MPIAEQIIKVDVRVQKAETEASAVSKDLQTITSIIALNYYIDPSGANLLYRDLGPSYKDRVIDPAIQEAVKAVTARYTAEQLPRPSMRPSKPSRPRSGRP